MALSRRLIDPFSFATLRIASRAGVSLLIVGLRSGRVAFANVAESWRAAASLAAYAANFP